MNKKNSQAGFYVCMALVLSPYYLPLLIMVFGALVGEQEYYERVAMYAFVILLAGTFLVLMFFQSVEESKGKGWKSPFIFTYKFIRHIVEPIGGFVLIIAMMALIPFMAVICGGFELLKMGWKKVNEWVRSSLPAPALQTAAPTGFMNVSPAPAFPAPVMSPPKVTVPTMPVMNSPQMALPASFPTKPVQQEFPATVLLPLPTQTPPKAEDKTPKSMKPPKPVEPPATAAERVPYDHDDDLEPIPKGEPLGESFTLMCGSSGCQAFRPKKKVPVQIVNPFFSILVDGTFRAARSVHVYESKKGPSIKIIEIGAPEYPCHHCLEPLAKCRLEYNQNRVCPVCGRIVYADLYETHHMLLDGIQRVQLFMEDIHYFLYWNEDNLSEFLKRAGSCDMSNLSDEDRGTYEKMRTQFQLLHGACRYLWEYPWEKLGDDFNVDAVAQSLLEDYPLDDGGLAESLGRYRMVRRQVDELLKKRAGPKEITEFQNRLLLPPDPYIHYVRPELREILKNRLSLLSGSDG